MSLGRMLDLTIDAYVIPTNYRDYIFEGCYGDENMPSWFEMLDITVDESDDLILNIDAENYVLTPGTVVLYDSNPFVANVVGIYDSVEEASDHCYVPGVID